MGICFIGNKKFKNFIKKYIKNIPGNILNEENEVIGKHNGMFYTTIGQREGIGIGGLKNSKNYGTKIRHLSFTRHLSHIQVDHILKDNT